MADATIDKPVDTVTPTDATKPVVDEKEFVNVADAKKAFKERDELRKRLEAVELEKAEREKKEIEEKQLYKEQLAKVTPELEVLRAEKKQRDADEIAKIDLLVSKIPEGSRGEYDEFISQLPNSKKLSWLEGKLSSIRSVDSPAGGRPSSSGTKVNVKSMSYEDKIKYYRETGKLPE